MNNNITYSENIFDSIKHLDENGNEFWYARELQKVLEYTEWRNFYKVMEKAKIAYHNSNCDLSTDFVEVNKIVTAGATCKSVIDYQLSRYACYLIVQNGDPRKQVIALGQTYFATKTRQQELMEQYDELSENSKRLAIRSELTKHNKSLAAAAQQAGVNTPRDYAVFQNRGYQGLYGGLGVKEIHARRSSYTIQ